MPANKRQEFDFDLWAELAERDPAAFEQQRAELIEELLQAAPAERQQRLRGLQWRIDRTREQASNPLAACIRISQMMWDSLLGSNGLLEVLEGLRGGHQHPTPPRAPVLNFPRRSRGRGS